MLPACRVPRRVPLAVVAAAATLVTGYGLAPHSATVAAPTPTFSATAASFAQSLEPAPLHKPATAALKRVTVIRKVAKTPVLSSAAHVVSGKKHHTVTHMAPAVKVSESTVRSIRVTPKPAPKPVKPATASAASYPWASASGNELDTWGFTERQCVSYAAWRMAKAGHALDNRADGWGDASHWDEVARAKGFSVSSTPHVGDVAQWNAHESSDYYASGSSRPTGTFQAGGYGHVGYVTAVYSDGSVQVAQYNALSDRNYSSMRMTAPRFISA